MKKFALFAALFLCSMLGAAQTTHRFPPIDLATSQPSGTCPLANALEQYGNNFYICSGSPLTWQSNNPFGVGFSPVNKAGDTGIGPLSLTGPLWTPQVAGIYTVDGVTYTTCAQAIAAAQASSWAAVTVDCSTSLQHGTAANTLAGIDPGSKSFDLNLGGVVRTLTSPFTVRTGFHVHGLRGNGTNACVLQANYDGVMFKDPADGSAVYGPVVEGCTLLPVSGATTASIAIDYDQGSTATTDILDHWTLRDLFIANFPGGDIRVASAASNTTAVAQFGLIDHVDAEPPLGGGTKAPVQIEGDVGNTHMVHLLVNQDHTDSTSPEDLDIGDNGGTQNVYRLDVKESTIQLGQKLITLHGCIDCVFESLDFEGLTSTNGVYLALGGSQNRNITFDKCKFDNNIGSGAGGYLWDGHASGNALTIAVENCSWGNPTKVAIGDTTSYTQVWTYLNNHAGGPFKSTALSNLVQGNTATLVLNGMKQAMIDDTTTVTNITSWLAPGEPIELCAQGATLTLSNSGNLFLNGLSSITMANGQCQWFALDDYRAKIDLIGVGVTGAGAAVPTGPTSTTANDFVTYADTAGTQQDSGLAIGSVSRFCGFATFSAGTSVAISCTGITTSNHCTFSWFGNSLTGGVTGVGPGVPASDQVTVYAQTANSNGGPVFCD